VPPQPQGATAPLTSLLTLFLAMTGCATAPAVGGGGAVYEIIVHSVNGRPTAISGPVGYPAATIQVGDRTARVWLAGTPPRSNPSPPLFLVDAAALRAGVLVETSWEAAVVHQVTEAELDAEAAVVHVPFGRGFHTVELRFRRVESPIAAAKIRP
jgi:hypothetical protein